jgi:hypothetical protein
MFVALFLSYRSESACIRPWARRLKLTTTLVENLQGVSSYVVLCSSAVKLLHCCGISCRAPWVNKKCD